MTRGLSDWLLSLSILSARFAGDGARIRASVLLGAE